MTGKMGKLGSGKRFKAGMKKIMAHEHMNSEQAAAIMASAGRKKYGAKKMAKWSAAGRKRAKS